MVCVWPVISSQNAWDYVHNSFGLLRTPWNLNGSPYVTRHNLTDNEVRLFYMLSTRLAYADLSRLSASYFA